MARHRRRAAWPTRCAGRVASARTPRLLHPLRQTARPRPSHSLAHVAAEPGRTLRRVRTGASALGPRRHPQRLSRGSRRVDPRGEVPPEPSARAVSGPAARAILADNARRLRAERPPRHHRAGADDDAPAALAWHRSCPRHRRRRCPRTRRSGLARRRSGPSPIAGLRLARRPRYEPGRRLLPSQIARNSTSIAGAQSVPGGHRGPAAWHQANGLHRRRRCDDHRCDHARSLPGAATGPQGPRGAPCDGLGGGPWRIACTRADQRRCARWGLAEPRGQGRC